MALVLVRLRLALLRAGARSGGVQGVVALVFAGLASLLAGGVFGLALAALRTTSAEVRAEAAMGALGLVFIVWALGPLVLATSDGTLPPERLAPFPLSAGRLMPGLALGALVGFGGLCSLLVAAGLVVGVAPSSALALLTVLGVVAHLLVCAVFSRLVITLISALARRRRGRDLALVLGPLAALGVNLGIQLLVRVPASGPGPGFDAGAWRVFRAVLMVLPSGPPGLVVAEAARGRAVGAVAALVLSAGVLLAGLSLWRAALERALTTTTESAVTARGKARSLYPWFAAFLPRNRWGAVAARELRLTWRDPRQRVALFAALFAPAFVLFTSQSLSGPGGVLFGAFGALVVGITSGNLWGFDGRAAWMNAVAPGDPRHDVVGKVVARSALAALYTVVAVAVLGWRVGSFERAPDAVALSVAAFGLAVGGGVVVAVRMPYPLPDTPSNVFSGGNAGGGFAQGMVVLALMIVSAIVLIPCGMVLARADAAAVRAALGLGLVAVGVAATAAGVGVAGGYLRGHEPELFAALSRER